MEDWTKYTLGGIGLLILICLFISQYKKNKGTKTLKDSYSQIGQDTNVINYFNHKKNGYFIDIGATDGIDINNTYLLEKKYGWKGICIEPQQSYWTNLNKNRNCIKDNSLLYSSEGLELEFSNAGVLGGITSQIDRHLQAKKAEQVKLKTETLNNILNKYNAPKFIDYVSLDTEGSELEILKGIDFNKYKFGYLNIEHNYIEPRRTNIRKFLESKGYKYYRQNDFDDDYINS